MFNKFIDFLVLDPWTKELQQLNEIWAKYNDGILSDKTLRAEIFKRKWNHHIDKVDLLVMLSVITKK